MEVRYLKALLLESESVVKVVDLGLDIDVTGDAICHFDYLLKFRTSYF